MLSGWNTPDFFNSLWSLCFLIKLLATPQLLHLIFFFRLTVKQTMNRRKKKKRKKNSWENFIIRSITTSRKTTYYFTYCYFLCEPSFAISTSTQALKEKNKTAINLLTWSFDYSDSAVIISSVSKVVQLLMMTSQSMLLKRPVSRTTAVLFFLVESLGFHLKSQTEPWSLPCPEEIKLRQWLTSVSVLGRTELFFSLWFVKSLPSFF